MTKSIWFACLAPLLAACSFTAADDRAPPPPSADALALARARIADTVHLVLVTADDGDAIDGADLGPLDGPLLGRLAARGAEGLLADAEAAPAVRVAYTELLPPVDADVRAVEVGENYPGAEEAPSPYLFPNHAVTMPALGNVPAASAELLDYQVALCMVLGEPVAAAADFERARKGFFLCQHLIDRGLQISEGDFERPEAAAGVTVAGRRRGYWRTGPYLYVPADARAYAKQAALKLEVNGRVRQDAPVSAMRWPIGEIAKQTLAVGPATRWTVDGVPTRLYDGAALPAGLVFVTGTPAGVVYEPPGEDFIDDTRARYVLDAVFLSGIDFDEYVKTEYVASERASGRYLRAGDRIEATGTFLGRLAVRID